MQAINMIELVLQAAAIICAGCIIVSHKAYFQERFQKGVVSVLLLAMLFFLIAYTVKMLILLLTSAADLLHVTSPVILHSLKYGGLLAQFGVTGGLLSLALLTVSGRYDQIVHLKITAERGDNHAKSDSASK